MPGVLKLKIYCSGHPGERINLPGVIQATIKKKDSAPGKLARVTASQSGCTYFLILFFLRLLESGRLEIVSGGWVMPDEANPHYSTMLEQLITGNYKHFIVLPID